MSSFYLAFGDGVLHYHCPSCGRCCRGYGFGGWPDELAPLIAQRPALALTTSELGFGNGPTTLFTSRWGCLYLEPDGCCQIQCAQGYGAKPLICKLYPLAELVRWGPVLVVLPQLTCPLTTPPPGQRAPLSAHADVRALLEGPRGQGAPPWQDVRTRAVPERAHGTSPEAEAALRDHLPYDEPDPDPLAISQTIPNGQVAHDAATSPAAPDLLGKNIVASRDDFIAGDPAALKRKPLVAAAGRSEDPLDLADCQARWCDLLRVADEGSPLRRSAARAWLALLPSLRIRALLAGLDGEALRTWPLALAWLAGVLRREHAEPELLSLDFARLMEAEADLLWLLAHAHERLLATPAFDPERAVGAGRVLLRAIVADPGRRLGEVLLATFGQQPSLSAVYLRAGSSLIRGLIGNQSLKRAPGPV